MSKKVSKKKERPAPKYVFSRSTRRKMAQAHTGKKLSPETKAKISAARREREALIELGLLPRFKHSEETRKKLSRIMKRKKHKPSKEALAISARERSNKSKDRKIVKAINQGKI